MMTRSKAANLREKAIPATILVNAASQPGFKGIDVSDSLKGQTRNQPGSMTAKRSASKLQNPPRTNTGSKKAKAKASARGKQKPTSESVHVPKLPIRSRNAPQLPSGHFPNDQSLLEMRKAVSLLFMLTEFPLQPPPILKLDSTTEESISAPARILTFAEEERLTGVFAFLASTTNDPLKVKALCLEEVPAPPALILKIAANHGDLKDTKQGLENVAQILKDTHEKSSSSLFPQLLEMAIRLNQNRILCRLNSRHAKSQSNFAKAKLAKGPILLQVLQLAATGLGSLQQEIDNLRKLHISLESLAPVHAMSETGARIIADIVQVISGLLLNQDFRALLPLQMQTRLAKLGRYVSAVSFLIEEARRLRVLAALRVHIVVLKRLPATTYVPLPEDMQSIFPKANPPLNVPDLYRHLSGPKKGSSAAFQSVVLARHTALVNVKCAVHAEMQLLFHYEFSDALLPPRVILSTKKACYLCHAFFVLHGRFSIPITHGRIYEKWTLPRCIRDLHGLKTEKMQKVLGRFFDTLVEAIRSATMLSNKMGPTSNESLFLQSSIWPTPAERLSKAANSSQIVAASVHQPGAPSPEDALLETSSTIIDVAPGSPQPLLPSSGSNRGLSRDASSHLSSYTPVVDAEKGLSSCRLDEGTSLTLPIPDLANPKKVKTKSAHFSISSSHGVQTPASKTHDFHPRQRYVKIEHLTPDQLLHPHHQTSHGSVIDLLTLVPDVDVDVKLDQLGEDEGDREIYLSCRGSVFSFQFWDGPSTPS